MTRDPRLKFIGKASKERWTEGAAFQMERRGEPEFCVARAVFEADEKLVEPNLSFRCPRDGRNRRHESPLLTRLQLAR